jgi:uncharacterized DUF497 family protein
MPWFEFMWNDEIHEHLAQHGVTPEEFEDVVRDQANPTRSRSTGERAVVGETTTGRLLFCVYRMIDELNVEPVTAYEVDDRA